MLIKTAIINTLNGWGKNAKSVIIKSLIGVGISKVRYAKYGHSTAMTVEEILDSAIGELVRVPIPDPDAVAVFGEEPIPQGRVPVVLQIDWQMESTALPPSSTKLVASFPASEIMNSGIGVQAVIKQISTDFEAPHDEYFIKCVGKVTTTYFRIFSHLIVTYTICNVTGVSKTRSYLAQR